MQRLTPQRDELETIATNGLVATEREEKEKTATERKEKE